MFLTPQETKIHQEAVPPKEWTFFLATLSSHSLRFETGQGKQAQAAETENLSTDQNTFFFTWSYVRSLFELVKMMFSSTWETMLTTIAEVHL